MIGTSILRYATNALGPDVGNLPVGLKYFPHHDPRVDKSQKQVWLKAIIPLAILYAFSLVLSNIAYVHLSIPFVQMIKVSQQWQSAFKTLTVQAATPVLLQLISLACGISSETGMLLVDHESVLMSTEMDTTMSVILICISAGCITATMGEVWFDTIGLVCQVVAVAVRFLRSYR